MGWVAADWDQAAAYLEDALDKVIQDLSKLSTKKLLAGRWAKYEAIGSWREE